MSVQVERLIAQLEARIDKYEKSLAKARGTTDQEFGRIERRGRQMTQRIEAEQRRAARASTALTSALGLGRSMAFGLFTGIAGGLGAVTSLTGALAKARSAISEFDAIAKRARQSGLSSDLYQALGFGALEEGVSLDKLNSALDTFATNSARAVHGQGRMVTALRALNPELLRSIQNARTQEERLRLMADAIHATSDAAQRAALSQAAFGTVDVSRVFAGGSAAMDDFIARARAMGIVVDESLLARAEELDNRLSVLAKVIDMNLNVALIELAPLLVAAAEAAAKFTTEVRKFNDKPFSEKLMRMLTFSPLGMAMGVDVYEQFFEGIVEDATRAATELDGVMDQINDALWSSRRRARAVDRSAFDELIKALGDTGEGADEVRRKLTEMAEGDRRFQRLADQMFPLLDRLQAIRDEATKVKSAIGGVFDAYRQYGESRRAGQVLDAQRQAFFDEMRDEATRSRDEQELITRTAEVMRRAEEAGIQLSEGAARIEAAAQIAAQSLARAGEATASSAAELIRRYEGFRATPYWDVNAFRVGFGSDTVTLDDGSVQKVTQGITVTLADANRDLARRIDEFQRGIVGKIGAERFAEFNDQQKAVLTSIAYNYGSLPDRIVRAIMGGTTEDVVAAIRGLSTDNAGINRSRRMDEADIFLSGAPAGLQADIRLREQHRDVIRQTLEAIRQETAAIEVERGLIGASNAERERERMIRETLLSLQRQGVEITDALRAAVQAEADARYGQVVAYDAAAEAADRLRSAQEDLAEAQRQADMAMQDAMKGFISDMIRGKKFTEALTDAVGRLGDRLLNIGLDMLFSGFGGGGGRGGILGLLGGLFGFAQGGIAQNGKPKTFAHGGVSKSAAIFGETGRAEAAVPLPDGRRIPVEIRQPTLPQPRRQERPAAQTLAITVNVEGANGDEHIKRLVGQGVTQGLATFDRMMPARIADVLERHG